MREWTNKEDRNNATYNSPCSLSLDFSPVFAVYCFFYSIVNVSEQDEAEFDPYSPDSCSSFPLRGARMKVTAAGFKVEHSNTEADSVLCEKVNIAQFYIPQLLNL